MSSRKYLPVDLPRDCSFFFDGMDEEAKSELKRIRREALSQGRWSANENIPFNVSNPEFLSYWLHKSFKPLKHAMKGSGIEDKLSPYKKTCFDLNQKDFEIDTTYRLSATGDLMFAKYLEESKDHLYKNVDDLIFGADYRFSNLESTLAKYPEKKLVLDGIGQTPKINITIDQYLTLTSHRGRKYDALQLANNHILDCGEEGLMITVDQLKKDGIAYLGVYKTKEDSDNPQITYLDDIKIGWVSHTFGVNDKPFPKDKPWICNQTPFHYLEYPDTKRLESQIKDCKSSGCDLILIAIHWGLEHECYPHPVQLKFARKFAELGVDAIIGHHPHVPQPIEIIQSKDNSGIAVPVIYSLGNLTPPHSNPATVLSLVANLIIAKGRLNGQKKVSIIGLSMTPVVFMKEIANESEFASLIPLLDLNKQDLDDETRAYVNKINEYAELVLGKNWDHDGYMELKKKYLS